MTRRDPRRLPPDQIDAVVKRIYALADSLDWEHLSSVQHTAQYDKWVTEPLVGGQLLRYMSAENARSWIKDGPMKEYGRSRHGAGRYAQFGQASGPTTEQIIKHALGPGATVVLASSGIKPFHCRAVTENGTTFVVWGEERNLRHLVWASINYLAEQSHDRAVVVLIETMEHPTTSAQKMRHHAIAKRCSIDFRYFRSGSASRISAVEADDGP